MHAEFGDKVKSPHWAELLRSGVAIFDLDYDAILSAMYALSASAEGDCYWCVQPDSGIDAAALGASEFSLLGTAPAEALHTFTLDSGASRCFFRDSTTLTPLPTLVPVRLADPSGGLVVSVSPLSSRVRRFRPTHCQVFTSPRSLQTWSGSTPLLVLPLVARDSSVAPPPGSPLPATPSWHALPSPSIWSSQVSASPPALACPALPSLRRGAAARRSSLLVSPNDCSRADSPDGRVVDVLIPWILAVRLQLRERFRKDLHVLRLHSDSGCEFSSDLLRDFCRGEGVRQSFTLPDSPQQNGIAKRCIGSVMEVARTSMIQTAALRFLWPFVVRYTAHQLNIWPLVSFPETTPTLRWTRKVGDATVFWVWGSRAFVRDTSSDKLSRHHGRAPSGVSQVDPHPGTTPVEVAVGSDATRGAASGGAEPGVAESESAGSRVAEPRATTVVAEFASASPLSIGVECALGTDFLEDRQEDFECLAAAVPRFASMLLAPKGDPDAPDIPTTRSYVEAITGPYSSQWQAAMDAKMASWKSTGTYGDVAAGFSACLQGTLHWTTLAALGFAPSTADPSLFLCTDTSLPSLYVLLYVVDLVFATVDTKALTLVKSELQNRHTCTDLGELHSYLGLQITQDRAQHTITLTQSHMVHHVLQRVSFYTLGMGLVLGGQGPFVLTGHADASWVDDLATQWSSQGYTFSLGSGSVSWRSIRSFSVLSSTYEAEIYARAMAAQELW
ncbi:unnamed protein product [Closterium sp. NIES-53]